MGVDLGVTEEELAIAQVLFLMPKAQRINQWKCIISHSPQSGILFFSSIERKDSGYGLPADRTGDQAIVRKNLLRSRWGLI